MTKSRYSRASPEGKRRILESNERSRVKRLYGLTVEEYRQKTDVAHCAICGTDTPGGRSGKWNLDHCHKTGRVREALCFHCNWMLGHAKDSPEILSAGIDYLRKHNGEEARSSK